MSIVLLKDCAIIFSFTGKTTAMSIIIHKLSLAIVYKRTQNLI